MLVSDLSPKEVFYYFEKISSIPRGSGNTGKIADYLVSFANEHSLLVKRDNADNVIIFKNGSKGYEDSEPVILQGHIDMVCEKESECTIDMKYEGVVLCTDGVKVWADKTTLGADDGIAVAYMLAVLASDSIEHPPVEAVFTSDEEIGMLGAVALDTSVLTAKRLINIDSETEGVLFASCAGGVRAACEIPVEYISCKKAFGREAFGKEAFAGSDSSIESEDFCTYKVSVSGLMGGHSGIEIHKQHANAIRLLAGMLNFVNNNCDLYIAYITGGGKENAIPKEASAIVCIKASDNEAFVESIKEYENIIKQDLSATEPGVSIKSELCENAECESDMCDGRNMAGTTGGIERVLTSESSRNVIFALQMTPDGVYRMNPDIEGMVQTSLNLGTAFLNEGKLTYKYLIRSNTASGKKLLLDRVTDFVHFLNGTITTTSDYPAWEYRKDSELRDVMIQAFKNVYGYEPQVTSVHAGLECGILSGKMPDVDMISFGPTLMDVHTPDECMDVASAQRSWRFLLEVLKNM